MITESEPESTVGRDTKLPTGKTCEDCAHVERCLALGFTPSRFMDACWFYPSRFISRLLPVTFPQAGDE